MTDAGTLREIRRRAPAFIQRFWETGWYHSFELPDGTVIEGCMDLGWQRKRWGRFPIPEDLHGKRVLDIGAWDGWFSFEAERRGAQVTSVDLIEVPNYLYLHRKLGSHAEYRYLDIYELPAANIGTFDIVFCLGVVYHLRHPLLGLEIVCSLATGVALIETFVTDGATWREHQDDIPTMEFYETDELKGQFDNWNGPTVGCLLAMCRAAGFARVSVIVTDAENALVACYRKWEPEPLDPAEEPPELLSAVNAVDFGVNFTSTRDQYVSCRFRTRMDAVSRDNLCLEIGEFGSRAVAVRRGADDVWIGNFRVPPGTVQGWNTVRLRLANSRFSEAFRIAVDMPLVVERITVRGVRDSRSWQSNEVKIEGGGYLSCWVSGLPANADRANVRLWLGDERPTVMYFGEPDAEGTVQLNGLVPERCGRGEFPLVVECAGVRSESLTVRVV